MICERCNEHEATTRLTHAPKEGELGRHWVVCTDCCREIIAADLPDEVSWLREMLNSGMTIHQAMAELEKNMEPTPPEGESTSC